MKGALFFVVLEIIFVITSCKGDNTKEALTCSNRDTQNALQRLRGRLFKFSATYLNDQIRMKPNETCNFSPPYSLYTTALMAKFSHGKTLLQILRALNIRKKNQAQCPYIRLKEYAESGDGLSLSANIYSNTQFEYTDCAQSQLKRMTGGRFVNVDFAKSSNAVTTINDIIKKDTQNEITDVLSTADKFTSMTELAVIIAIKLNTTFPYKINFKNITNLPFYVKPKVPVEKPFFYLKNVFNYTKSSTLKATVIKVPCQDPYYGIILLPNEGEKIENVVNNIKDSNFYNIITKCLKPTLLQLTFPIFMNITTKVNIKSIVKKSFKLSSIFSPNKPQLDGFVVGNKNVSISYGVQKCIYAGTFEDGESPAPPKNMKSVVVNVNRPYIYILFSKDMPLICGYRTFPAPAA